MWSHRPRTLKAAAEQSLVHGNIGAFIREFVDEFYELTASADRHDAVADEPPLLDHPTANAYLAAVAEHLCLINRISPPPWTQQSRRFLKRPFFPAGLESLKATCIKESPTAFRRRMIFVDANPLYRPRKETARLTAMLTKSDILMGLRMLDEKAKAASITVDLAVYGGAALAIAFDMRTATRDVDAVMRTHPNFVRQSVCEIAREKNWPAHWLNDGVKGFLSASEQMQLMQDFQSTSSGGLRVYTPTPEYLFAMKCMAMRIDDPDAPHDIADIKNLATILGLKTAADFFGVLEQFYPASQIPPKTLFGVEEIASQMRSDASAAQDHGSGSKTP